MQVKILEQVFGGVFITVSRFLEECLMIISRVRKKSEYVLLNLMGIFKTQICSYVSYILFPRYLKVKLYEQPCYYKR